ncbi:MAG: ABC transporter permease [Acidobacteria bacterium]|nr:ABC transporter permease [Acidobacteriota bacterium]
MKLILHLLHKDIRQWWYEIAMTLLVLFSAAFTAADLRIPSIALLISFLSTFLSPIAMVLLAGRVVQAERWPSPLEDWRTRPVSRFHLLSAKAIFLLVFLVLPTLLSYLIVFRSLGYSSAVWWNQSPLLIFGALVLCILPAAAIAAVSASVGQAVLMAVGLLAGVLLTLWGFDAGRPSAPEEWRVTLLLLSLFALVTLACLYCQIILNRTAVARIVLALGTIGVAGLSTWPPLRDNTTLRDWMSPLPATLRTMKVNIVSPERNQVPITSRNYTGLVTLRFPTEITGTPSDMWAISGPASLTVRGPGRKEYRLPVSQLGSAATLSQVYSFLLPRKEYVELSGHPVELDLQVWAFVYADAVSYTATIRDHGFDIPDVLRCGPVRYLNFTSRTGLPLECDTAVSNVQRLEASWQKVNESYQPAVTVYGDHNSSFARGVGGRALINHVYSGDLLPGVRDGEQIQVRHYQTVHQWHKTIHLSGVRLDDYRQTAPGERSEAPAAGISDSTASPRQN